MKKSLKYTWSNLESDIKKIVKVYRLQNIENVYGIPRGGLIPAVMLSHRLKKPLIIDEEDITAGTLIIDDISDSGKTIRELLERINLKNVNIVCPWIMVETKYMPRVFFRTKKKEQWVIFPWESLE